MQLICAYLYRLAFLGRLQRLLLNVKQTYRKKFPFQNVMCICQCVSVTAILSSVFSKRICECDNHDIHDGKVINICYGNCLWEQSQICGMLASWAFIPDDRHMLNGMYFISFTCPIVRYSW